ncbi:MAG: hypothetical protein AAF810_15705 [Cyanobacteria bacterium P01_D01_bin.36]
MQTSKRKISARLVLRSTLLSTLLLVAGCGAPEQILPTDAEMLAQWQTEKDALLNLVEACEETQQTYDLAERYIEANGLIATAGLSAFEGCEIESGLKYLAKNTEGGTTLLVTDQNRRGTGWIEERASNWTGGWVSWKSAILEEKGFLYLSPSRTKLEGLLPRFSVYSEPLDQFAGEYRVTGQISGNSSCEVWYLRLIEPGWYLFYHQSRECPT